MREIMDRARRIAARFGNDPEFESAAMFGLAKGLSAGLGEGGLVVSIRNACRDELRAMRRRRVSLLPDELPAPRAGSVLERMVDAGHASAVEALAFGESVSSIAARTGVSRAQAEADIDAGIAWARREVLR